MSNQFTVVQLKQARAQSPSLMKALIVFVFFLPLSCMCLCVHVVLVVFVCCDMDWGKSMTHKSGSPSTTWTPEAGQVIRRGGKSPCPLNDLSGHWHFYRGKAKPTTQSDWQFQTCFPQMADKCNSGYRKIFLNSKPAPTAQVYGWSGISWIYYF